MDVTRIYLFDIDGTLVRGGGAGRHALSATFKARFGRADALTSVRFHGRTDRAILRAGLGAVGVPVDEEAIDAILGDYLSRLPDSIRALGGYRPHAGVTDILEALSAEGAAIGLGTGNVEAAAMLKVGAAEIAEYFAFGGYGSDAEARAELLEHGARRGAAHAGTPRESCDVVVIGDTELDVAAAHAIGATCVAVATGDRSIEQLADAGADAVFADLSAPGALAAIRGR